MTRCTNRTTVAVVSAINPVFGHPRHLVNSWRRHVLQVLRQGAHTPFYLFSCEPVAQSYQVLKRLRFGRPGRWWFSAKTQPLDPLWRWWRSIGGEIEVVSELEFRRALDCGFSPDAILVNGPAKHRWLPKVSVPRLRVHFDSRPELEALAPLARRQHWRVGIRICTPTERDPEHPDVPTQFGFEPSEAVAAVARMRHLKLEPESVHIHLRTNVRSAAVYTKALTSVARVCDAARWKPRFLDAGGGLPPPFILDPAGRRLDAEMRLSEYAAALRGAVDLMPSIEEVWMEHGRFPCAPGGVLVVQILDVKSRSGLRQLICDGGRTLHALVSNWEQHALHPLNPRTGRRVPSAVYGPTCMAFDCLAHRRLPATLRPGDHLIWFDAGAYHLPWETQFSHGLAEIWWENDSHFQQVRRANSGASQT